MIVNDSRRPSRWAIVFALLIGTALALGIALPATAATTSWQTVKTYTGFNSPASAWVDHTTQTMYVIEADANDVAVYDLATNQITAHIPVGSYPQEETYNPNNGRLYIGDRTSHDISVIDTATNTVVDTIALPDQGFGLAGEIGIDVASNRLYVPVLAPGYNEELYVIDGANDSVITTIPGDQGGQYGVAVDEATNTIYVASQNSNAIAVYDGATNTFSHLISLGGANHSPQAVRLDPVTDRLYVGNASTETMSVIDLSTSPETVLPEIPLGTTSGSLAVDPAHDTVAITTPGTDTMTLIDGATDTVDSVVPVGGTSFFTYWDATDDSFYTGVYGAPAVTRTTQVTSPTITSLSAAGGMVGHPYHFQLTATGTTGIRYSVTSGALPHGVALNPTTGLISGTPTEAGSFTFQITADNTWAPTDRRSYTLVIVAPTPPIVVTTPLQSGTVGAPAAPVITPTVINSSTSLAYSGADVNWPLIEAGAMTLALGIATATTAGVIRIRRARTAGRRR